MLRTDPTLISAAEAERTSSYLRDLADSECSLPLSVQCLFGRCCLSAVPEVDIDPKELAEEAGALVSQILSHPQPGELGLDPLLLIETEAILSFASTDVSGLRTLLGRISEELMAQPAQVQQIGRVRNIAARLSALGLPARVAKPARATAELVRSPERWFSASTAELAELVDHLFADGLPLDEIPAKVLSLIALAELRNYRIDLGCALLRAVLHLSEPCIESTEALHFIALQRRRDGRYGFPNQYAEAAAPGADQQLTMYLPLTLNAVWLFRTEIERRERVQLAAIA